MPQRRPLKGESVRLTSKYLDCSDAKGGPLKPGDLGVLIEDDGSGKPYHVEFGGSTYNQV